MEIWHPGEEKQIQTPKWEQVWKVPRTDESQNGWNIANEGREDKENREGRNKSLDGLVNHDVQCGFIPGSPLEV